MSKRGETRGDPVRELEAELSEAELELLDQLAEGIVKRRLTPAAIFFLESVKPLGYVGSQVMLFFRPIIQTLWSNPRSYDTFAAILERRGSIELLLRRIEAKA